MHATKILTLVVEFAKVPRIQKRAHTPSRWKRAREEEQVAHSNGNIGEKNVLATDETVQNT